MIENMKVGSIEPFFLQTNKRAVIGQHLDIEMDGPGPFYGLFAHCFDPLFFQGIFCCCFFSLFSLLSSFYYFSFFFLYTTGIFFFPSFYSHS